MSDMNNQEVVSPGMASMALGQSSVMDDVTDLSMFGDQSIPQYSTPLNPNVEMERQFEAIATTPPPQPEATPFQKAFAQDTRMNSPVPNEPARRESFSSMLERFKNNAARNVTPNSTFSAPTFTPPPAPVATPPVENKVDEPSNEPEWMKLFRPAQDTPPAPEPIQAPVVDENIYSSPMNERMTKYFTDKEREILNNAMQASSATLDNAQRVFEIANSRGLDGRAILDRINSVTPEQVLEMLEVYENYIASRRVPAPAAPQQFRRTYEPVNPVPGVSLGQAAPVSREPQLSPLGQPRSKWQI